MPRIGANTTEHTKRKSAARKKPLRSKLSKLESKAKVHGRQKRLRHVSAQMKRQRIGLARSARASQPTHEARLASHQCRNKRARRWPRLARDRGKYSCLTSSGLKTTKAADPAKDAAAIRGELVGCGGRLPHPHPGVDRDSLKRLAEFRALLEQCHLLPNTRHHEGRAVEVEIPGCGVDLDEGYFGYFHHHRLPDGAGAIGCSFSREFFSLCVAAASDEPVGFGIIL